MGRMNGQLRWWATRFSPMRYTGSERGDTGVTAVCDDDGLNGFVCHLELGAHELMGNIPPSPMHDGVPKSPQHVYCGELWAELCDRGGW